MVEITGKSSCEIRMSTTYDLTKENQNCTKAYKFVKSILNVIRGLLFQVDQHFSSSSFSLLLYTSSFTISPIKTKEENKWKEKIQPPEFQEDYLITCEIGLRVELKMTQLCT